MFLIKIPSFTRMMFIIGIIIAGGFLFFDWYIFQAFDDKGNLIVYWSFNPIFSWYTIFASGSIFNELYTPTADSLPFIIIVCFLICLAFASIGLIYKTPNRLVSYINMFTLLLVVIFIVVYPIIYLLPYKYYFPNISLYDPYLGVIFQYSINIGYIMEVISFIFLFPYTILYYRTVTSIRQNSQSSEEILVKYIHKIQEPLDLDRYIQEEELELNHYKKSLNNDKIIKK
ncbi:MAG: hypothetical protein ACFFEY_14910 [Candidatus Thorarchaeota archaeon]